MCTWVGFVCEPVVVLQRAGSYVAKGGALVFTGHCLLLSAYVLFLAWRGLRRYGPPHPPHPHSYGRIGQVHDADARVTADR